MLIRVIYLKPFGVKILEKGVPLNPKTNLPLIIVEKGMVTDLNKKAWEDGIRPGDTERQAKLASSCRAIKGSDPHLKFEGVARIMASFTPFVEIDHDGLFVGLFDDTPIKNLLDSIKHLSFLTFCGESSTKLVSKAVSLWTYDRYAKSALYPKNIKWGNIEVKGGWIHSAVRREKAFISQLPMKYFWGLPEDVADTLGAFGVGKAGDLQKIPLSELKNQIGNWGVTAKGWSLGKDSRRVQEYLSNEIEVKTDTNVEISKFNADMLLCGVNSLYERLEQKGLGVKMFSVKVSGEFPDVSVSKVFTRAVLSRKRIVETLNLSLQTVFQKIGEENAIVFSVTLIASELEPVYPKQKSLWERSESSPGLDKVFLGVRKKFGQGSLIWGKEKGDIRRERMLEIWDPMRASFENAMEGV